MISNLTISGPALPERPSFTLTETGGQSGAWIISLVFTYGIAQDTIGDGCLVTEPSQHVTAGGTWTTDLIYPYECPDLDEIGQSPVVPDTDIVVTVNYLDDAGHRDAVSGSAPRPQK